MFVGLVGGILKGLFLTPPWSTAITITANLGSPTSLISNLRRYTIACMSSLTLSHTRSQSQQPLLEQLAAPGRPIPKDAAGPANQPDFHPEQLPAYMKAAKAALTTLTPIAQVVMRLGYFEGLDDSTVGGIIKLDSSSVREIVNASNGALYKRLPPANVENSRRAEPVGLAALYRELDTITSHQYPLGWADLVPYPSNISELVDLLHSKEPRLARVRANILGTGDESSDKLFVGVNELPNPIKDAAYNLLRVQFPRPAAVSWGSLIQLGDPQADTRPATRTAAALLGCQPTVAAVINSLDELSIWQ